MKYSLVFALAAVSSAFVVPSEEILAELAPPQTDHHAGWYEETFDGAKDSVLDTLKKSFGKVSHATKDALDELAGQASNALDDALGNIADVRDSIENNIHDTAFDVESWLETEAVDIEERIEDSVQPWYTDKDDHPPPPPPPPPHHGGKDGHHRRPHRPHHGHKPNATVYQLIAGSKYTTKLAFYINQYPDLVKELNSTKANYTIFAPTDRAFERVPEHAPKPSKEEILALLSYHVVPDIYPAGRVLSTHTVPTLFKSKYLGSEPQRLSFHVGLRGLTVNFYSRIIAINIFGTNGVIHGVDHLLVPPPRALKIIDLLPGEFSTLELGLAKTGLIEKLNSTETKTGGTLFAPSNFAFKKLGPRINAFLFSEHGVKYLKALIEYHVVPEAVLYSDAYYASDGSESSESVPRGRFHVELPTLLKDRKLSIDVARWAGFITIKINGFTRVSVQDGIAADGVIHVLNNVLIPPRKVGGAELEYWTGDEMEVDDFKARLEPLVTKTDL